MDDDPRSVPAIPSEQVRREYEPPAVEDVSADEPAVSAPIVISD
jgi:hypothetical protein